MSQQDDHETKVGRAGRSVILAFHKVQQSVSFGVTNCPPNRLTRLLEQLIERGYNFASVGETIKRPEQTSVAITFDDGYAHLRDVLPPLVQRFGLRPTVFVPTGYLGRDNLWDYSSVFRRTRHLDTDALRELAALGIELGAHGHRHIDLTRCRDDELQDELQRPRKTLEDILGAPVVGLSYPFGRVDRRVAEAAAAAGYRYGLTMRFPRPNDSQLRLGRLPVYGFDTSASLLRKIQGGRLYGLERFKCEITNRLSAGTTLWRYLSGR